MTSIPDSDVIEFRNSWRFLCEHPHLRWTPPAWRNLGEAAARSVELRAVERNLLVRVETNEAGTVVVLSTGPLRDFVRDGTADPFTPAMTTDERLQASGCSFEDAVVQLASRVAATCSSGTTDVRMISADDPTASHKEVRPRRG